MKSGSVGVGHGNFGSTKATGTFDPRMSHSSVRLEVELLLPLAAGATTKLAGFAADLFLCFLGRSLPSINVVVLVTLPCGPRMHLLDGSMLRYRLVAHDESAPRVE